MNNDFGYIDDKPFKTVNVEKQPLVVLNEEEDILNIKMNGVNSTDTFDMFDSEPGKLTESKVYYGVDSKLHPLSFLNSHIVNTTWSPISSSMITSKIYAKGRESYEQISHLTPDTKIRKFDYYNDKLIFYFSDNPLTIKRKGFIKELNVYAKKTSPKLLFSIPYKGKVMKVFLIHSFISTGNIRDLSIKSNTYLEIVFNKGITVDDVIKISSRLDSTLHLCILNKNKSYVSTLYDFSKRSYNLYNLKNKTEKTKDPIFNICKNKNDRNNIFKGILMQFIDIDFEKNNTFLPFLNFNKGIDFHELEFLQYYKVLEVIDFEKQKKKGKGKDKCFLKKYFKKYPKLKDHFFKNDINDELEEEVRSLRNYYSHEGFYLDNLPIPTDNPTHYKKIDIQWLYDVKRLVKIIAYLEMYDKAGVVIDELELINHLY